MTNKAQLVLEKVSSVGASGDIIIDQNQSLSLKANNGSLEEHKVSSSQVFGLRLIKNNRVGTAYSEADDEESLMSMVDQALVNASFANEEKYEQIQDNQSKLSSDDKHFCPEDETSIDHKVNMVLELEKDLLKGAKIKSSPYNGLSESLSERHVFSTAGLEASLRLRHAMLYAYALAEDGDKNAMEGKGQLFRTCKEFDSDVIINSVQQRCLDMLDGREIASGRYDVIFDTESQVDLWNVFSLIFSGKSAKDGINPWRENMGKVVADERLSFSDKPLLKDGFGYQLFDAEGTPAATTPLIVNGRLENLLHNSATAAYFGIKTTGHAVRGPKSSLGVSGHQFAIEAGTTPTETLEGGDFFKITSLSGLHSGANPISGDFSFGASGYLYRDGKVSQVVRGVTVAGNFYTMLNKISGIGNECFWNWGKSSLMPLIRFEGLAVSGK